MRHGSRLANLPERIAAGAFILNSGLTKLQADKESANHIHEMAKGTYPMLEQVPPEGFAKGLGMAEVAIGGALLFPLIGDGLAGLALTAFSGGLVGLYMQTPGMRQEGGVRPTQQGTALAKDIWLLGIGLSLVGHSVGARRQARKIEKVKSKRAERRARRKDDHSSTTAKVAKAAAATKAAKSAASALTPSRD